MTHHVAIAYPDHARAQEVVAALNRLEAEGVVDLKKAVAVIGNREHGGMARYVPSHGIAGAVAGLILGALLGMAFGEMGYGLIAGGAVGALAGIMIGFARSDEPENYGFGSFGERVAAGMPHGSSAVLMLVRKHDPDKAIAALKEYGGKVIHTTLPTDIETRLKAAVNQPEALAA